MRPVDRNHMSHSKQPDQTQGPSEIVERVAQAIYDAPNGIDGDQLADMLLDDDRISGANVEECRRQILAVCRQVAIAAIEVHKAALAEAGYKIVAREPSEDMMAAGADFDYSPEDIWRAMWDAAE